MRVDVEYLRRKYDEFNKTLFGGILGECDFAAFITGKGSEGRVLGWFCVTARGIKYNRSTRRLYVEVNELDSKGYSWGTHRKYINRSNFDELCKPLIKLNDNYDWNEYSMDLVLIHEMCHYANYVDGYYPGRSHGKEFMKWARIVEEASGGKYTVDKVATSETMKNVELSQKFKDKREKRKQNKISKLKVKICISQDEEYWIVPATTDGPIESTDNEPTRILGRYVINDPEFSKELLEFGYHVIRATYLRYTITKENATYAYNFITKYLEKHDSVESTVGNKEKGMFESIVLEVIDDINGDFEEDGDVIPGMNLGIYTVDEFDI